MTADAGHPPDEDSLQPERRSQSPARYQHLVLAISNSRRRSFRARIPTRRYGFEGTSLARL